MKEELDWIRRMILIRLGLSKIKRYLDRMEIDLYEMIRRREFD